MVGTLPDLEIGDIIYTKAKTRIFKTAIDNYFANRFEIEDYDKYIHKYMEINIPSSIKLYIHDINNKGFKYKKTVTQKGDKTIYTFTVKDAPMIIYEPNMDTYNLVAHHIMITSIHDWKDISRWYSNLVEKHLKTDKDIKEKVQELTKNLKSDKEKLEKLFYWVAKKIRYLGVDKEKDRPGLEPHDVTFTFHTRGGVCRDKAALLVAMLREAGINSDVILVSVGNILDKVAPVTWFNHAIVMAYDENGNPEYFLDPTDENTKDFLPAYEEDCSYLVASEKGNTLGIVPVSKPDKNKLLLTIENNINNDNSSQTSMHFTFIGLFDDFLELGAVGKFAKLGFEAKFMKNPVLKHPKLTKEGATFLHDFYSLFRDLKGIKQPKTVVGKIASSALYKYISDVLATKRAMQKDGTVDEKLHKESLIRITRKTTLLEELSKPYNDHNRFLNAMILGSQDLTQGEGVNLLSVHASKGLEYKEVYIVDLMDGRFPNRKLMQRGGSLDEERRLFYVAVTRAKDILYLSFAKFDKIKKMDFMPSQFLYEAGLVPKDEAYRAMVLKDMDKEEE